MKMILGIYFSFSLVFNVASAELQCSQHGLKILYINGVLTEKDINRITSVKINDKLNVIFNKLDKKSDVTVEGIHNDTRNLFNDLHELKAGLEEMRSGKRLEYWKTVARHEVITGSLNNIEIRKKVDEAFDQIYKKKYQVDPKTKEINRESFTPLDLYNTIKRFNSDLANIVLNAAASEEVIEFLKEKIISSYDNGKNKVIVIAHSQGNVVLSNAVSRIRYSGLGENFTGGPITEWFDSLSGYVQLATPSHYLVSPSSKQITLNADKIVNGVFFATRVYPLPPNYEIVNQDTDDSFLASAWEAFSQTTNLYHGVDEVYMSTTVSARRLSDNTTQTMLQHFQDNLIEVANGLENNCSIGLKVKTAQCRVSYDEDAKLYKANGSVNYFTFTATNSTSRLKTLEGSVCFTGDDGRTIDGYACHVTSSSSSNSILPIKFQGIGGGDPYVTTLSNPCYNGRTIASNGIVTINN